MRIAVDSAFRRGDTHAAEQSDGPLQRLLLGQLAMHQHGLGQLARDLETGLSDVIGSWNTMAMPPPRIFRSSSVAIVTMSRPWNMIWPLTMRAGSSISRISDRAATVLPDPDSPTIPSVSPAATEKLTPSTARTTPSSV